ncbi:MAG: TonB-dependent receptor [Bacteroidia bacterium]|nr:TonB-dependent receptor [Bacteroidia bacterium]
MNRMCLLAAFGLLPLLSWGQSTLRGKVQQQGNDAPIAGAEIRLAGMSARSDAAGAFALSLPAGPGRYELTVQAPGYQPETRSLRLPEEADAPLVCLLTRLIAVDEQVLITATRASEKTATTYSTVDRGTIRRLNSGRDIPFLLDQLPSVVVNSDAGAGIGYTGIRIRGSDPTRTNVTINGIPLNDPESHGVFWVNLPDLASSVDNIQVQRGVGTSTNGAGAFGATLNLQTSRLHYEPYAEYAGTLGAFNTRKHTLSAGTGLIGSRFAVDARLSSIYSDGWVDRAFSDLNSWYVSAGYYGKKSLLKLLAFSGAEQTYQSWWGIPEAYLDDQALRRSNYYTYENETDNYRQDHYQLHYTWSPRPALDVNASLHYTYGRGYYEQFREADPFSAYGLPDLVLGGDTLRETDLIRRRWLDNHFYGTVFSVRYRPSERVELTLGGGLNRYDGEHFGELIWMQFAGDRRIRDRYYESHSRKLDGNVYLKGFWQLSRRLSAFADLQYRQVDYVFGDSTLRAPGTDNDLRPIQGDELFRFFNPKAGLTWTLSPESRLYASWSVGSREPVRSDFIDAPEGQQPLPETLYDLETGYRLARGRWSFEATGYWMRYRNQLVLNGEINDVGASVRRNVPDSYRLGIELAAAWQAADWLTVSANLALSRNRIRLFEEYLYDYDPFSLEVIRHENVAIAFSPAAVAGASWRFRPVEAVEISLVQKYVGRQFLDNTANRGRSLDPFFVQDLQASWLIPAPWAKELRIGLAVNNLLNAQYEPNGYTFSYKLGGVLYTENYYYPQAGVHALGTLTVRL